MADKRKSSSSNKNISINGDVVDSVVVVGDNNQTVFQKIINYIFPSEKETLEQRNRRILLGHVENAWIKGVLDASLHGAALLDLGIKQDPEAVTKYPWTLKKESTDENLPTGLSMLEIFDSIGMGRSLLVLGAPGSGKTTMLLELARGLIARAREDVTYPIPMVFNLASWTEKLTLADWLAQELNNLYSVPRKTAPDWVKGDKLLLLLDGLDEVRQESRAKCVEAINEFRKQNGLTSLTVCSRSQDYANLNAKLSFEGAIEVQPLTQEQIAEFLNRFGDEVAGINRALEKDNALREMSEMPLFLSIMLMAYRNKRDVDIWVSQDEKAQRKHLIDTYIERMFERPRSKGIFFKKQEVLCWLSWLASKMKEHNQIQYVFENMQPNWLDIKKQVLQYNLIYRFLFGLIIGTTFGFVLWFFAGIMFGVNQGFEYGLDAAAVPGIFVGVLIGLVAGLSNNQSSIILFDFVSWNWNRAKVSLVAGLATGLFCGLVYGVTINPYDWKIVALVIGLFLGLIGMAGDGLQSKRFDREKYPGQKVIYTLKSFFSSFLVVCFTGSLISALVGILIGNLLTGLVLGLMGGAASGLIFGTLLGLKKFGGLALIQHYALRYILARNNLLPWRLVPFLDHCVDLIFLRRVGGGYIFVHRLLMEHFADMYVETPISKGNQK